MHIVAILRFEGLAAFFYVFRARNCLYLSLGEPILSGMKPSVLKVTLLFLVLFLVCGSLPAMTSIDKTDTEKSAEEQLEEELLKQERLKTTLISFGIIALGGVIVILGYFIGYFIGWYLL